MQTQFVVFHGLPFFGSLFFVWENTIRERRGTSAETGQRSVAHRTSAFEGRPGVPFSLLSFHSFWIQAGWERKICKNYTCRCVRSLGNLFRIFSPYDFQHLREIFRGCEGCSRSNGYTVFIDLYGRHPSCYDLQQYYYRFLLSHGKWKKSRMISRLKGMTISTVARKSMKEKDMEAVNVKHQKELEAAATREEQLHEEETELRAQINHKETKVEVFIAN
ncbi:hypothetical protein CY35_15G026800 [Sphagnum magellanicum]|nr:hypothetical protein CY35_15G026800 [Sphagnum magellanicum]